MNYSVEIFKQMKNFRRLQNQIGGYQTLTCPSKIRPGAYNEVVEMHLFENHEIRHSITDFQLSEMRTTALSNSTISTGIHNNPQKEKRSKKERGTADDGLLLFKGGVTFLKNSSCNISIILQQRKMVTNWAGRDLNPQGFSSIRS